MLLVGMLYFGHVSISKKVITYNTGWNISDMKIMVVTY